MVLGWHDGIDQCIFIVICIFFLAGNDKQTTAEFQHIVCITCFVVTYSTLFVQHIVCTKVLILTVTSGNVCMTVDYHLPEGFCILKVLGLSVVCFVTAQSTKELRNGCVGMFVVQNVRSSGQHTFKQGCLIEFMSCCLEHFFVGIVCYFVKLI